MDPLLIGQIVLAALVVFVPIVGFNVMLSWRNKYKHKANWQKLALSNQLKFNVLPSTSHTPVVQGKYHGYDLNLTIETKLNEDNQAIPYTRIILTQPPQAPPRHSADQPLTPGDLMRPFISTTPALKGKVYAIPGGRQIYYEQYGIEADIDYLQHLFDFLVKLANAYPKILTFGSQAASLLQKNTKTALVKGSKNLRPLNLQLLDELTQARQQTQAYQVAHRFCPHCLTRFALLTPSDTAPTHPSGYGCRTCRQSKDFLDWAGPLVAVLDNSMRTAMVEKGNALHVNWFSRQSLFDFEQVKIMQATDETVERFAVLVGNDTDEVRRPGYAEMKCTVLSGCHLSENTLRILRHTFGQVELV